MTFQGYKIFSKNDREEYKDKLDRLKKILYKKKRGQTITDLIIQHDDISDITHSLLLLYLNIYDKYLCNKIN